MKPNHEKQIFSVVDFYSQFLNCPEITMPHIAEKY